MCVLVKSRKFVNEFVAVCRERGREGGKEEGRERERGGRENVCVCAGKE